MIHKNTMNERDAKRAYRLLQAAKWALCISLSVVTFLGFLLLMGDNAPGEAPLPMSEWLLIKLAGLAITSAGGGLIYLLNRSGWLPEL